MGKPRYSEQSWVRLYSWYFKPMGIKKRGQRKTLVFILLTSVISSIFYYFTITTGSAHDVGLGWMWSPGINQRGLYRDGSGLGIRSQVYLLPEHNLGYVYVQNAGGDQVVEELNEAFLDRYYPASKAPPIAIPDADLSQYVGVYRPIQTNENTLVKLVALFSGEIHVTIDDDRVLKIEPRRLIMGDVWGGFDGASRWVEIAPQLFRRVDRERYVAFQVERPPTTFVAVKTPQTWHRTVGKTVLFCCARFHHPGDASGCTCAYTGYGYRGWGR
jgi:hypothetical protein